MPTAATTVDFCRWEGAWRAAMPGHRQRRATHAAAKSAPSQRDARQKDRRASSVFGRAAPLRWPSHLLASGPFASHRGYRHFVNTLVRPGELSAAEVFWRCRRDRSPGHASLASAFIASVPSRLAIHRSRWSELFPAALAEKPSPTNTGCTALKPKLQTRRCRYRLRRSSKR